MPSTAAAGRRPGAAAGRMAEDGGRGGATSPAAARRFVRCLYAVGFLVSGEPAA